MPAAAPEEVLVVAVGRAMLSLRHHASGRVAPRALMEAPAAAAAQCLARRFMRAGAVDWPWPVAEEEETEERAEREVAEKVAWERSTAGWAARLAQVTSVVVLAARRVPWITALPLKLAKARAVLGRGSSELRQAGS